MKNLFLSALMSILLVVGLIAMVSMAPTPPLNTSCKEQCAFLVNIGFYPGTGKCMSACNVCLNKAENNTQFAVCFCKVNDVFGENPAPDQQCVKIVKGGNIP